MLAPHSFLRGDFGCYLPMLCIPVLLVIHFLLIGARLVLFDHFVTLMQPSLFFFFFFLLTENFKYFIPHRIEHPMQLKVTFLGALLCQVKIEFFIPFDVY